MSTETTQAALDAAFEGGFDDEQPANEPAAEQAAPTSPAADEAPKADDPGSEGDDELAGLPPKVRAMLDEFQQIKQAVQAVPGLEQRLRKTEGRIGDLNTRLPAPPPPAAPKLEKVERVRAELPEVAEAIEEFVQHHLKAPQTADKPEAQADDPALLLDRVAPDWRSTVQQPGFVNWVKAQGNEYHNRIEGTSDPAEMLDAVTRFKAHALAQAQQEREAAASAQRVAQTRQSRASAAAVPAGAGRRAPTPASTLDDAFAAGFNST